MTRTSQKNASLDVLYGNMRIRRVEADPLAGTLIVRAVCVEGEEQTALYQDVLYSQLDPNAEGKRIAIVVELTPDELRGGKHQSPAARFQRDCELDNMDAVEEMSRRGYRLFLHFVGQSDEFLVVAKGLRVT